MEYACHGDLTHLLDEAKNKRKRIPEATVWKILSDLADGNDSSIKAYNIFIKTKLSIEISNLLIFFVLRTVLKLVI